MFLFLFSLSIVCIFLCFIFYLENYSEKLKQKIQTFEENMLYEEKQLKDYSDFQINLIFGNKKRCLNQDQYTAQKDHLVLGTLD